MRFLFATEGCDRNVNDSCKKCDKYGKDKKICHLALDKTDNSEYNTM